MQNFDLLREVGKTHKPVLLKRGLAATVKDWLLSAEYVLSQGNRGVILCERGIKTFEDSIRYTMDISSIPVVRKLLAPADHRRSQPRRRQARLRCRPGRRRHGGRGTWHRSSKSTTARPKRSATARRPCCRRCSAN